MKVFFAAAVPALLLVISLSGCNSTDQPAGLTGSDDPVAQREAMNDPYYPVNEDTGYSGY